jgi:hypothetical protein
MAENFNTAAAILFGIGGGLIWIFLGFPASCADDPTGRKIPAVEEALGGECEKQTFLGTTPIVASEEAAIVLGLVLGLICAGIAGVLASSSSSSSGS